MSQQEILKRLKRDHPLKLLSTFGIGGPARFFVEVKSVQELQEAFLYCANEKIPFFILGKGSNSLFHDRGFNGLVIANKISFYEQEGNLARVGAGYSFSLLGTQTARKGLAGLEFASGIPASVGGAVYMNAGANGTEVCETLKEVTYVHVDGTIEVFKREQLEFAYRYSSFQRMRGAIAEALFVLQPEESAREKQKRIIAYRSKTQPYGQSSAGCVFRNPEGESAGALIEKSGLKGKRIGDAEVSLLHANFIVNRGTACAEDVRELVESVRQAVKEKTGFDLEMEVRSIPYEDV